MVTNKNKENTSLDMTCAAKRLMNGINKKLSANYDMTPKDTHRLTEIMEQNNNYYMIHEGEGSKSSTSFSVYDSNCHGSPPVLCIPESQIPGGCAYTSLVKFTNSKDNVRRAKNSGALSDD